MGWRGRNTTPSAEIFFIPRLPLPACPLRFERTPPERLIHQLACSLVDLFLGMDTPSPSPPTSSTSTTTTTGVHPGLLLFPPPPPLFGRPGHFPVQCAPGH